ncbi:MAG TPA: HD domain-containing protein [Persephonella sp.]|nr:HD domain-containing protein [Persephonella sp.]
MLRSTIDKRLLQNLGKKEFLNDFTDITLLKLTAFFHDIGKAYVKKKDRKYIDHDIKGAEIFKRSISEELSLGNKATNFVSELIKNHLSVFRLYYLYRNRDITDSDINFFWYENKENAVHLFILTISDAYGTSEDDHFLEKIREFIIYLQSYYFDIYLKSIVETPLLSGKEIMEILSIEPSPKVGYIKDKLLKAQIEGKIRTKQQAVEFIKELAG